MPETRQKKFGGKLNLFVLLILHWGPRSIFNIKYKWSVSSAKDKENWNIIDWRARMVGFLPQFPPGIILARLCGNFDKLSDWFGINDESRRSPYIVNLSRWYFFLAP